MKKTFFAIAFLIFFTLLAWILYSTFKNAYEAIYTAVMVATIFVIAVQSWATRQLAEGQMMAVIDVNMIYDSSLDGTYFWFYNSSNFPAFVELQITNNEKKAKIGPLRIAPKKDPNFIRKTDELKFDKTIISMLVKVTSALEKNRSKYEYKKTYHFVNNEWCETTWAYPDDPFPIWLGHKNLKSTD